MEMFKGLKISFNHTLISTTFNIFFAIRVTHWSLIESFSNFDKGTMRYTTHLSLELVFGFFKGAKIVTESVE